MGSLGDYPTSVIQVGIQPLHTVDGQNPFRTSLKPWLKPQRSLVFAGEASFKGFLGGAGFRASTVWVSFWLTLFVVSEKWIPFPTVRDQVGLSDPPGHVCGDLSGSSGRVVFTWAFVLKEKRGFRL